MTDREFVFASVVFACIGAHAAADAIRATDCDDSERICQLANESQCDCLQVRIRDLDRHAASRECYPVLQDAYRAVNDALVFTNRAHLLRAAERSAMTVAADAWIAAKAWSMHFAATT